MITDKISEDQAGIWTAMSSISKIYMQFLITIFSIYILPKYSSINYSYELRNEISLIFKNLFFASIFGYCIGIIISFIFAKSWVFKGNSSQPLVKSFSLFCIIYCFGGIEMSLVIIFLNRIIDNYKIAWLFGALIGSLNNYLGSKYLSFKK